MQSTTDIWFTGYLQTLGYPIEKYDVIRRGKGIFYFNLTDDEWRACKLKFSNSPEWKFKERVELTKDLTY